ncbi:MAG: hypothetical protein FWB75_02400 [Oscillospiraceae bacterium]|nr:hypothetical protein [Oscillospiraceae bacterium]
MQNNDIIAELSDEQLDDMLSYTPVFTNQNRANIKKHSVEKITLFEHRNSHEKVQAAQNQIQEDKPVIKLPLFKRFGLVAAAVIVVAVLFGATAFAAWRILNIDIYEFIHGEPSESSVSAEAAAHTSVVMLERLFDIDVDEARLQMAYQDGIWAGFATRENSDYTMFHFRVNAENGQLLSVHYSPWGEEIEDVVNFEIHNEIIPTPAQNLEFATLAISIVDSNNILQGYATRARLLPLVTSPNRLTEEVAMTVFAVQVENDSGLTAILSFHELTGNAPKLTSITVDTEHTLPAAISQLEGSWVENPR